MEIREDDPRKKQATSLLAEHLEEMKKHSRPDSIHSLDVNALCAPEITFYTAWEANQLVGCGALLELDHQHGEIKSMRTAKDHRRKGVARRILEHILLVAKTRAYTRLSLETGSMKEFKPARDLYASYGFTNCDPFANYALDSYSVWMTRAL